MKQSRTIILGICSYSHEACAALLIDGEIKAVVEQERMNREKHTWKFPREAILECMAIAKVKPEEISELSFFIKPTLEMTGNIGHLMRFFPSSLRLFQARVGGGANLSPLSRIKMCLNVSSQVKRVLGLKKDLPVTFVEHHLAHAASAFYCSGFEQAAILTLDGRGESSTTLLGVGSAQGIKKIQEVKIPHSLGHLYAAFTAHLGFDPFHDEWKVMGMSAYGTDRYVTQIEKLVSVDKKYLFRLNLEYFQFHTHGPDQWFSKKFHEEFGLSRRKGEPLEPRHFDLAFALQRLTEKTGVFLAQQLFEKTQQPHLCMAGGVALNVLMNQQIMLQTPFEKIFVQPLAHDAGAAMGSTQWLYFDKHKRHSIDRTQSFSPFLGPSYTDDECERVLIQAGLSYQKFDDITQPVARHLADGKIIGWFQGKMEAGPRALGNRSILADPRSPQMKDRINLLIKKRESFRPFAPAILIEYLHDYFDLPKQCSSPYMIMGAYVKEDKRTQLGAVTHVDSTARPQSVSKELNPLFWQLIHEFHQLSGVPVLLNTSFNENEPIVCTPLQAVECYQRTQFDVLVLGPYMVTKS